MHVLSEYIGTGTLNNPYRPALSAHFQNWSDITGGVNTDGLLVCVVRNFTPAQETAASSDNRMVLMDKTDRAVMRAFLRARKGGIDQATSERIIQDPEDADVNTVADDLRKYIKNGTLPPVRKRQ